MKDFLTDTLRGVIYFTCVFIIIANLFLIVEAVRIQNGLMMNAEMISAMQQQINELMLDKPHKK